MSRSAFSNVQLNVVGPQITTSALSGGPPSSPTDGDIWIASAVDANGTRWMFQYNAGSASLYKWEFVGGPPARVVVGTFEFTTTTGSWVDTTTVGPSYTTVRAGDYQVSCEADMSHSVSGTKVQAGPALGAGSATDSFAVTAPAASGYGSGARLNIPFTGLSASQEIRMRYFSGAAGTMGNGNRVMLVIPVRIS